MITRFLQWRKGIGHYKISGCGLKWEYYNHFPYRQRTVRKKDIEKLEELRIFIRRFYNEERGL